MLPITSQSSDDLLDENKAAQFLGLSPGTLAVWRTTKRYPLTYIKVGRLVRYRKYDLNAFLKSRTVAA
jgi:predicted DNA-binding transcriptional regulator AlpA